MAKAEMRTHEFWPRIRLKGDKARYPSYGRPTLRKIAVQARRLNRNAKAWRGVLKKTAPNDAKTLDAARLNLSRIRAGQARIRRYLASLAGNNAEPVEAPTPKTVAVAGPDRREPGLIARAIAGVRNASGLFAPA